MPRQMRVEYPGAIYDPPALKLWRASRRDKRYEPGQGPDKHFCDGRGPAGFRQNLAEAGGQTGFPVHV